MLVMGPSINHGHWSRASAASQNKNKTRWKSTSAPRPRAHHQPCVYSGTKLIRGIIFQFYRVSYYLFCPDTPDSYCIVNDDSSGRLINLVERGNPTDFIRYPFTNMWVTDSQFTLWLDLQIRTDPVNILSRQHDTMIHIFSRDNMILYTIMVTTT